MIILLCGADLGATQFLNFGGTYSSPLPPPWVGSALWAELIQEEKGASYALKVCWKSRCIPKLPTNYLKDHFVQRTCIHSRNGPR